MKEYWKQIKNFEDYYEVSNLGNIKGLRKKSKNNRNSFRTYKERILKQTLGVDGYKRVTLYGKERKTFLVHRLVALEFISNPLNKSGINHKNGIKDDNRLVNLEWCTQQENVTHAWNLGLITPNRKPVLVLSMNNEPLLWFDSIKEASDELGLDSSGITKCCKGKYAYCGDYKFKYYKGSD